MSLRSVLFFGAVVAFAAPSLFLSSAQGQIVGGILLYSGGGGAIGAMNLDSSGSLDMTVYESPGISAIDSLVRTDSGEILFGECGVAGDCALRKVTPGASAVTLRTGHLISYLPKNNRIFFYDILERGESWLFAAPIDSPADAYRIARKSAPSVLKNGIHLDMAVAPIPIAESEVIFVGENGGLWIYNSNSRLLDQLDVDFCYPYAWVESQRRLLCGEIGSNAPFLLDIIRGEREEISEISNGYGFVYLSKYDAIVYGKSRSSWFLHEASDVFIYFLKDGTNKRLRKNVHLRYGVWFQSW
jgi:hypothetical protein